MSGTLVVQKAIAGAAAVLLLTLGGCEHPTAPPLSIAVEGEALAPTSDLAGANTTCCCRVRGFVRNTSAIPLNVRLDYIGYRADGTPVPGQGIAVIVQLPEGGRRAFDAPGLFESCAGIARTTRIETLRGIFLPPEGQ